MLPLDIPARVYREVAVIRKVGRSATVCAGGSTTAAPARDGLQFVHRTAGRRVVSGMRHPAANALCRLPPLLLISTQQIPGEGNHVHRNKHIGRHGRLRQGCLEDSGSIEGQWVRGVNRDRRASDSQREAGRVDGTVSDSWCLQPPAGAPGSVSEQAGRIAAAMQCRGPGRCGEPGNSAHRGDEPPGDGGRRPRSGIVAGRRTSDNATTGRDKHSRRGTPMTSIDLYVDPVCPFAWVTSRWLLDAATATGRSATLRQMNLAVLNEGHDAAPAQRAKLEWSRRVGRVFAAATDEGGP